MPTDETTGQQKRTDEIILIPYAAPDNPRWQENWSVTVGPGSRPGSKPPLGITLPPSWHQFEEVDAEYKPKG